MEVKKYHQVGVRVSDELLEQVTKFAEQEQRSVAQVFRLAVEQYMKSK